MFGRLRASPVSSLELEIEERPPPKIIKQDSLSIYESTLLKLKQGARRLPDMDEESTMAIDAPEVATMPVDGDSSSMDACTNSSISFQSTCFMKQSEGKNMSILHFFSKCKNSHNAQNSDDEEPMSGYDSPTSVLTTSVDSSLQLMKDSCRKDPILH